MRAVVLRAHGGPEVLTIEDVPDPVPGPEEILVDVVSTAVNRADVLQRMGFYPPPYAEPIEIPGLEFAGTVSACGARAARWKPGDQVMGLVAAGAYAARLAVHERQVMAVPADVAIADAGAIPEVFITAWDALVIQGGLTSGRWALVHAGASGVGTAAIQIAKAMGARIAVTCSAGKTEACRELGADLVLERTPHDWAADAAVAVPGGFDTVLDVVGGDELARNLAVVAPRGRVVQVGVMAGGGASIDLGIVLRKRLTLVGTALRSRPIEEKIAVTQRFAAEVLPLFAGGRLRPIVDSRYALDDVASAHARMEANANTGKIVLSLR